MLSHELRNPLAALTNASTVLRLTPPGPDAQKAQEVIERQTKQMGRLVEDLLDVSRITLGKATLHFEPVELSALVRDALRTSEQAAKLGHHDIETDLSPAWVNGDRARLEQVVVNLLDNAIKFTPSGGAIEVYVRRDGGDAVLEVADSGVGIAPGAVPHVFERFFRADASRSTAAEGAGLGLSLVKWIADRHAATVSVHRRAEGGTTMVVRMPVQVGQA